MRYESTYQDVWSNEGVPDPFEPDQPKKSHLDDKDRTFRLVAAVAVPLATHDNSLVLIRYVWTWES